MWYIFDKVTGHIIGRAASFITAIAAMGVVRRLGVNADVRKAVA